MERFLAVLLTQRAFCKAAGIPRSVNNQAGPVRALKKGPRGSAQQRQRRRSPCAARPSQARGTTRGKARKSETDLPRVLDRLFLATFSRSLGQPGQRTDLPDHGSDARIGGDSLESQQRHRRGG